MSENNEPHWIDKLTDEEVKTFHRGILEEMAKSPVATWRMAAKNVLRLVDESESPDELARLRTLLKTAAGDWSPDGTELDPKAMAEVKTLEAWWEGSRQGPM